jgi:hypothetical protein
VTHYGLHEAPLAAERQDVSPTAMNRRDGTGICGSCDRSFGYALIHTGFNDSAYGYCDRCGTTALFSASSDAAPSGIDVGFHGPIRAGAERFVLPCACGGQFRGTAVPRCPHCVGELSANASAEYIERNAPGTAGGWRWQRSWQGLYAIVIDDRLVENPWRPATAGQQATAADERRGQRR